MHIFLRLDLGYQVLMTLCIPALTVLLMPGLLGLAAWVLTLPDFLQWPCSPNATHSAEKLILTQSCQSRRGMFSELIIPRPNQLSRPCFDGLHS
jgi:hypothetical protein